MIEPARLSWREGQPYSERFGDIYHSPDGVGEVERVFLQPAAFDQLLTRGSRLQVGELGFGTGLNFAVIAQHCLARKVPVHFVSFEAHPLACDDFRKLATGRAAGQPIQAEMAAVYPPLLEGWHRRSLADGLIRLSLYFGDASEGLEQLVRSPGQPFDLWLLDGFAPDRNPELWTEPLFLQLAALSQRDTRVTTFTAAGRVRRGLAAAGFEMRKVDQRPFKWESLAGSFAGSGRSATTAPTTVSVIGAGLAGASVARHLAEAGVNVQVYDAKAPAAGASSVPVTVMHARLLGGSDAADLRSHAFAYAAGYCRPFTHRSDSGIRTTGALQIPSPNFPVPRLEQIAARYGGSGAWVELLSSWEASDRSGLTIDTPALWFPDACVLNTPQFCRTLLDHPRIHLCTNRALDAWPDHPAVLACGGASRHFPGAGYLELADIGGQIELLQPAVEIAAPLSCAIVGHGYLAPADTGGIGVGATYEHRPWSVERATHANLEHSTRLGLRDYAHAGHHKALRCVSSDRAPVIGVLTDLRGDVLEGRYVSTGHGSMGTVSGHFGAMLIVAQLLGEFVPASPQLLASVEPARFRLRQARRGYRFGATD